MDRISRPSQREEGIGFGSLKLQTLCYYFSHKDSKVKISANINIL